MGTMHAKHLKGDGVGGETAAERCTKMAEMKAQAIGLLDGFPDLIADYERFTAASRALTRNWTK